MALLFSAVKVTADGEETELLVGGIPREYDDLEGWSEFDDFMEFFTHNTEVSVHAEAYVYGEGEAVRADPEEIAYFMKRIEMREDFLASRCDNIESVDFSFQWLGDELFEMEMD